MCGIAGILNLNSSDQISLETLKKMLGALRHRGPDESGVYLDDRIGLGHTRLSIIDLSGGTQPIHNEDETLWIVFNGEIFNYPELRSELTGKGHCFYTATDTEVILHLYEDLGPSCLEKLNGQFALAVWDREKKELFLARDRLGILPLYYTVNANRLIFGSEIKAVFMAEGVSRRLDPGSLDQVFTFWTTLPGRTAFDGIREIPPGHYMKVVDGSLRINKYWEPVFCTPEAGPGPRFPVLREEIFSLIQDAVRIRLRADVPVGCYLSGGLDSSGVTALVKKKFNNRLRTFGIHFEEAVFDERGYQSEMVECLAVDHTELAVGNEAIGHSFEEVLWHCEKPMLRTAPVPLYLLSGKVREEGYKVVLTGEGADEVFGGYNLFREAKIRRFWAARPDSRLRPLLIQKLYPYIFQDKKKIAPFVQSFFGAGLDQTGDPLFSHLLRWRNTSRIKTFFSDRLNQGITPDGDFQELRGLLPEGFACWGDLAKAQYLETTLFLSSYLLSSQGDRVAMAHGVEIRPPYLDHRLIEFMARVPAAWKIKGLNEKYLLKETLRDLLPQAIVNRPKHPYRAPIAPVFLNGRVAHLLEDLNEGPVKKAGLFNPGKTSMLLQKMTRNPQAGELDQMALAGLLSTQIIYRQFIQDFPWRPIRSVEPDLFVDKRSTAKKD